MNIFTRDKPRIMNKTILAVLLAAVVFPSMLGAQNYFVDGFHGGVYGHYPLETYTGYMCDLLDDNPDLKIGLEIEPETWDSVMVVAPLDYGRLRERLAEGDRVEYNNPTYAQPYFFNIGGESVIRQLEYGIRKLEEHFPGISINTYACEEPCFTSCLPTVLAGFGFKYAAIKNPNTCWGGYTSQARGGVVRWTGPDGTFLRAVPRYSTEALGNDVWTTTANGLHPDYYSSAASDEVRHPVAMCFQDAGWTNGPWLSEERKEEDSVENVTWTEYFTQVAGRDKAVPYRMNQDDVRVALVWGSQVLQRIARSVRKAENSIVAAEKTGVIAHLANNYDYDHSAMDEAWRTLLLSQHHDSWIVPYNGLKGRGTWADWIVDRWTAGTERTAETILSEAAQSFGAAGSGILRVFNTLPYAREEVVETVLSGCPSGKEPILEGPGGETVESEFDAASGKLSFMAKVPAFGFAAFKIGFREKGKAPEPGEDNPYKIGNEFYEITFDPDRGGVITSIILKKEGSRELVRESDPCFGEMKGYFYEENTFHSSADAPASLEKCVGNLVSTMHVKGTVGGREALTAKIDTMFANTPWTYGLNNWYLHGNEPLHWIPFMYNRLGEPWKSQKWTRTILDKCYTDDIEGLVGNDDEGQMSAWYVLSAAGLHQICPGDNRVEIVSPLFERVEISLDPDYYKGGKFTIVTHGIGEGNIYIRKARLNGRPLGRCWLDFKEISSGGKLELWLGSEPVKNWGTEINN